VPLPPWRLTPHLHPPARGEELETAWHLSRFPFTWRLCPRWGGEGGGKDEAMVPPEALPRAPGPASPRPYVPPSVQVRTQALQLFPQSA